jgi:hypothetical protein
LEKVPALGIADVTSGAKKPASGHPPFFKNRNDTGI